MDQTNLRVDQVDSFKREGYLILHKFLDHSLIEVWREQFWAHLDGSLEDRTSWPQSAQFDGLALQPPLGGELPALRAVVYQLGRDRFSDGGCGVLARWPTEEQAWQMPTRGHLDGYPGEGCQAVVMLGMTILVKDIDYQSFPNRQ